SGGQSGVWIVSVIILSIGTWVGRVGPRPADGELALLTSPRERLETVRQVLSEVPLIDGHNDLPWNIRNFLHNQLAEFDFDRDLRQVAPWSKSAWSQTDLVRLRQGMVGGQFWAAYVPCESQHLNAVQLTLEQVDLIKRLIEKYSQHLQFAASSREILEAHGRGRIASLIGVEGGHSLGSSLAVLRTLYQLGVRYLTLTHTCNTPWAKSSSVEDDDEDGKLDASLE
ncbi:Dipeptidase 1, partial [Acromyrmex echinatior]